MSENLCFIFSKQQKHYYSSKNSTINHVIWHFQHYAAVKIATKNTLILLTIKKISDKKEYLN